MYICMLRHGETDWNKIGRLQGREDIPLNEAGIAQALQAARYLSGRAWRAVIFSPMLRARRTAQIVADSLGIDEVVEDARFIERDYGKASGLTMEQWKESFPSGRYDGAEDWESVRSRMFDGLHAYTEQYPNENIIIVTHGGAINAVLAALTDNAIGSGKTKPKPACLNLLRYAKGSFEIVFHNQTAEELLREGSGE